MEREAWPLVEPCVVPEIHIEGIAYVDRIGSKIKIAYYSLQRSSCGTGYERVICCKLEISMEDATANNKIWQDELKRLNRAPVQSVEEISVHH
jgi:hypothetical protein